ncbi:MAG: DUF1934 domain-containing protein [Oscillospiraceae bacterium]|nr:DUF1934 domain-containing protein [Oscillospiraceae bacterium]
MKKKKRKENYIITIDNVQYNEGREDRFTFSTVGDYRTEGDTRIIAYEDSAATGFEGSETTLHISPDMVTMVRTGEYASSLVLEKGKRHTCHYGTPVGDLPLGIYTTRINNELTDSGGTLDFSYSLDLNANLFVSTDLKITVREKTKPDA